MLSVCFVVVMLSGLCLQTDAGLARDTVNFIMDTTAVAGIELPGYMQLLMASRMSFFSKLIHLVFGDRPERIATSILNTASVAMPASATIEDLTVEKVTLTEGKVIGLKDIALTPGSQVDIIIDTSGTHAFIVPVHFSKLNISFKFLRSGTLFNKHGMALAQVVWNNIVLKFRLQIDFEEKCYLQLYDVIFTDMDDLDFRIKTTDFLSFTGGMLTEKYVDALFATTDGDVEETIKQKIADVLYFEIPLASKAICDNNKRTFKMSHFPTQRRTSPQKTVKDQMIRKKMATERVDW